MKFKKVAGIFLLSFLFLSGISSVYAEDSNQEYITIDLSKCTMEPCSMDKTQKWVEKVWIVHPRILISSPEQYSQVEQKYDGEFRGKIVEYLITHQPTQTKMYTSDIELEISPNIPPEVLEIYHKYVIDITDALIRDHNQKVKQRPKQRKVA